MSITAFAFPSSIGSQAFESCSTSNRREESLKSNCELYSIVVYTEKGGSSVFCERHTGEGLDVRLTNRNIEAMTAIGRYDIFAIFSRRVLDCVGERVVAIVVCHHLKSISLRADPVTLFNRRQTI